MPEWFFYAHHLSFSRPWMRWNWVRCQLAEFLAEWKKNGCCAAKFTLDWISITHMGQRTSRFFPKTKISTFSWPLSLDQFHLRRTRPSSILFTLKYLRCSKGSKAGRPLWIFVDTNLKQWMNTKTRSKLIKDWHQIDPQCTLRSGITISRYFLYSGKPQPVVLLFQLKSLLSKISVTCRFPIETEWVHDSLFHILKVQCVEQRCHPVAVLHSEVRNESSFLSTPRILSTRLAYFWPTASLSFSFLPLEKNFSKWIECIYFWLHILGKRRTTQKRKSDRPTLELFNRIFRGIGGLRRIEKMEIDFCPMPRTLWS